MSPSQTVKSHLFREILGCPGNEVLGFGEKEYIFLLVILVYGEVFFEGWRKVFSCVITGLFEEVVECFDGSVALVGVRATLGVATRLLLPSSQQDS